MRTIMKGGIWNNIEDEILKTAITKYGKNEWDRIASLFSGRRSSKQCKSRWYEYLDPSIKKLDWTKEEDEKLLHLAKLYPSQWRTIAPLVGRTSFQCIERYNKLLDSVDNNLGVDSEDDLTRLTKFGVGEIDPDLESRPARLDPVDMEEDEKQLLAEVISRVGNTKGKKAKRKQREKLLEEARRLVSMQKTRELKAAGIYNRKRKKCKGVDYNAEILFERKPPLGFFDVSEDGLENVCREDMKFPVSIDEVEGKRRVDEEVKLRKKDSLSNTRNMILSRQDDPSVETMRKRAKMVLPMPCMLDEETQEIGTGIVRKGYYRKSRSNAEKVERMRSLRGSLSSLPQPKNEYEIVVQPVQEEEEEEEELEDEIEEDMSDKLDREIAELKEAELMIREEIDSMRCEKTCNDASLDIKNGDEIEILEKEFENVRKRVDDETKKVELLERKVKLLTNDYKKLAQNLGSELQAVLKQIYTSVIDLECYITLGKQEQIAMSNRVKDLSQEIMKKKQFRDNNEKYLAKLIVEKDRLQKLVENH